MENRSDCMSRKTKKKKKQYKFTCCGLYHKAMPSHHFLCAKGPACNSSPTYPLAYYITIDGETSTIWAIKLRLVKFYHANNLCILYI